MSLGMRSGVHWMRENDPEMASARVVACVEWGRTSSKGSRPPGVEDLANARQQPCHAFQFLISDLSGGKLVPAARSLDHALRHFLNCSVSPVTPVWGGATFPL